MKKIALVASVVLGMVMTSCSWISDPMDDLRINEIQSETEYVKKTPKDSIPEDTVVVPQNLIIEGWDSISFNEVLTENTRQLSIDWVRKDTAGSEREHFEILLPRELTALTDWTSVQKSYDMTVSQARIEYSGQRDTTLVSTRKDGEAVWDVTLNEKIIRRDVTLQDSAEVDRWYVRECNNVSVTYKGVTYTFPTHDISFNNVSSVTADGKYSDELTYTYGENTKKSVAPGTIVMYTEPVIEPDTTVVPPVVIVEATSLEQTVAPSANKKSYFYTLIVRYSDNTMLPMVIDREGNVTTFDKVANDDRVNGLSLNRSGEWVLTKAEDSAENITYVTVDGKMNCQMSYTLAEQIGWDEGHQNGIANNGTTYCSVKTFRYTLNEDGSLTDNYTKSTIAF
jgi:hypothetical protein